MLHADAEMSPWRALLCDDSSSARPAADDRGSARGLLSDDRGAMMLLGIFMATIVVGMLYYLAGVGETITYRERMQDATDSGAYAGAMLHARAMNVIVLLNMAIASVFAIAVAATAAIFLIYAAAASAWSSCNIFNWSACLAAFCLTCSGIPEACNNADAKRDIARDVARNASNAADAIRTATFAASIATSRAVITGYRPPVSEGLGVARFMPIEEESPSRVCDEILAFIGPSGLVALPPDTPYPTTAMIAYLEARRIAGDRCSAATYVDRAGGIGTAFLWTLLACPMIRSDMDGQTRRITEGVEMGGDPFQFRAFAMANTSDMPFEPNRDRVDIVTWGETDSGGGMGGVLNLLEETTRFSVSQTEYYFDGDDNRRLWTWRMKWRARLRRFRVSDGTCPSFVGRVCEAAESAVIH